MIFFLQNKRGALKIFRLIWNQTEFRSVLDEEKLQRNHITLISKEIPKAFLSMNSTRAWQKQSGRIRAQLRWEYSRVGIILRSHK